MLRQYKNPIFIRNYGFTSFSEAETAINTVLNDNPGYCLVDMTPWNNYFVFDEDWDVPNPIHSVVLVAQTYDLWVDVPTDLSDNPGYRFVSNLEFPSVSGGAVILGKS